MMVIKKEAFSVLGVKNDSDEVDDDDFYNEFLHEKEKL